MDIIFYIVIAAVGVIYFLWNPTTNRIRKIQSLINKDRTVCDFINSFDNWNISNIKGHGLRIMVNPIVMPMYALYITYKGERPSSNEIKKLYCELTSENSMVYKAHKMNIPLEEYVTNENSNITIYVKKAIDCTKDIIESEKSLYSKYNSNDLVDALAKPTAIIDRFALIYAVVTNMLNQSISKEVYSLMLLDNMVKSGIIRKQAEDYAIYRFDERTNYFVDEIDIELKCEHFMPTTIIYTLRHPSEAPTREIMKVDPVQALIEWNIILKHIKSYFV